jgi:hypothetical protein
MFAALELALIVTLAVLLAVVSAVAGALWWKVRSIPLVRAARLSQELAERQRALEDILARLDVTAKRGTGLTGPYVPRSSILARSGPSHRADPPQPSAVAGPTLIAVPDLSAPARDRPDATAELARRFGSIWELADSGATADMIARTTGQPIGQVELIMGLRRRLAAAEGRT